MKDFELSQTYTQDLSIKAESMESAKTIADQNSKEKPCWDLNYNPKCCMSAYTLMGK